MAVNELSFGIGSFIKVYLVHVHKKLKKKPWLTMTNMEQGVLVEKEREKKIAKPPLQL